jgi:cytochrome c5
MSMFRSRLWIVIAGGLLLAACGKSTAPPSESAQASKPQPAPAAPAATSAEPFNLANLFPPGPGRDMVLSTCGSCHPAACVARGQRTAARWDSFEKGHKDKLPSTSSADLDVMFSYLKANFNDTKPEPQIPASYLQGCTPY